MGTSNKPSMDKVSEETKQNEIDKPKDKTFMGKSIEEHEADLDESKMLYKEWRKRQHEERAGFFPVFSKDFKPYLKDLSGNAVRLYVYLGLHSNNETGQTSNTTLRAMQYFFDCDPRTLQKWLAELENAGLIKRVQPFYKAKRQIVLKPYSTKDHLEWKFAKTENKK